MFKGNINKENLSQNTKITLKLSLFSPKEMEISRDHYFMFRRWDMKGQKFHNLAFNLGKIFTKNWLRRWRPLHIKNLESFMSYFSTVATAYNHVPKELLSQ